MYLQFLLSLLGLSTITASTPVVSISFNETLKGFSFAGGHENDSIKTFQLAYENGKLASPPEEINFSLHVNIVDVAKWKNDSLHNAICTGSVVEANVTQGKTLPVQSGGSLHVFDGGVLPTHELRMEYFLPFHNAQGEPFTLYGVKHMPGNDCLGLLSQATTLYVHVYDNSSSISTIVRSGIVKIGAGSIVSLISSIRIHGGTVADQIKGFLTFGLLLVGDILKNCFNLAAHETNFWYMWSSDAGTGSGVLLDLIHRPNTLELRVALYVSNSSTNATTSVTVHRQMLPLDAFKTDNATGVPTVYFGDTIRMSSEGVVGTIDGININISYSLTGRTNTFLPPVLNALGLGKLLPKPVSQYGEIGNYPLGGTVGAHVLTAATPLVFTTYKIPFGLDSNLLQWSMISASQFIEEDTLNKVDLQVEIVAMPLRLLQFLPPATWIAPTYILFNANEFKMNTLEEATEMLKIVSDGRLSKDNTHREISVEIQLPATKSGMLHIALNCTSPASDFAFLDKEGSTYIHSTVLGSCRAKVTSMNDAGVVSTKSYISERKCLLEIKH